MTQTTKAASTKPSQAPRLQDDFYGAVNHEWLQTAQIPADKPATAAFVELHLEIEKLLMDTAANWARGTTPTPNDERLKNFVAFYQLATNFDEREKRGTKPAEKDIARIQSLHSWEDVSKRYKELIYAGISVPYEFSVSPDMQNTEQHALYASAPELILPDKTYYENESEETLALLNIWNTMARDVLVGFGFSREEAQKLADQAQAYDKNFALFTKSGEEAADYVKMYNPYSLSDFKSASNLIDLSAAAQSLVSSQPKMIIVTEPDYLSHFSSFVTPENFENYKAWALVNFTLSAASLLTDDLRVLSGTYGRALSGIAEPYAPVKAAYYLAHSTFSMVVGDYYAKTYFGNEAREDVISMLKRMQQVYKSRLEHNSWLSEDTHKQAIVKLDALELHVGYPDRLQPYYDELIVSQNSENDGLYEHAQKFSDIVLSHHFSKFDKPVDHDLWAMSPDTVNAYYNPQLNCIVFPAAILQAPFYDLHQSKSANYGGIGAVMAHEMSHAFDNNGSKFDEKGNLANWWTQEDLDNFEARAKHMIEAWDGLESVGGTVNGTLTVSENIADAGGLSCALEAAKSEDEVDLKAFFENWARVWRFLSSPEYAQMLLAIDVHAPAKLRCNMQVNALDEFYETFDITEKDAMYVAPEKRVAIW